MHVGLLGESEHMANEPIGPMLSRWMFSNDALVFVYRPTLDYTCILICRPLLMGSSELGHTADGIVSKLCGVE
jgi:hypothetical protein